MLGRRLSCRPSVGLTVAAQLHHACVRGDRLLPPPAVIKTAGADRDERSEVGCRRHSMDWILMKTEITKAAGHFLSWAKFDLMCTMLVVIVLYDIFENMYLYCNAMQCHPMQSNAMQCNAMQCNAMWCNVMQCDAMWWNMKMVHRITMMQ